MCQAEPKTKALVALDESDPRLDEVDFEECPASFANNDLKYDIIKVRAMRVAENCGEAITYSVAYDKVTEVALHLPRFSVTVEKKSG